MESSSSYTFDNIDLWDDWDEKVDNPIIRDINEYEKHLNTLTESQKGFVTILSEWLNHKRRLFLTVTGGPGTGKTHTVIKTLHFYNLNIVKMAPTAKIAKNIGGKTIHSTMRLAWGKGSQLKKLEESLRDIQKNDAQDLQRCFNESYILTDQLHCCVGSPEIVVIDEVGMVPFWLIYRIVKHFFNRKHPILVIAMGDCRQLRPVVSEYNIFQVPLTQFEHINIDLKESKRFTPEYEIIIEHLRRLMDEDLEDAIFDYITQVFPVVEEIDANTLKKCKRALAYRNSTVENYNNFYLKSRSYWSLVALGGVLLSGINL